MCGRIVRTSPAEALAAEVGAVVAEGVRLRPRWNLCPGEDLVIVVQAGVERRLGTVQWGFVTGSTGGPQPGRRSINARAETVATRPAFRDAFRRRRCVVLADGFYEWKREGRTAQPFLVRLRSGRPMALAGLWQRWRPPEGSPRTTGLVITCPSTGRLAEIHDRMPVILSHDAVTQWLDPESPDPGSVLASCADAALDIHAVSPRVNSPRNDDAALLEPIDASS